MNTNGYNPRATAATSATADALAMPEIVAAIAKHMHQTEHVATACLVSKAWHALWTPILWRDLDFDRKEDRLPHEFDRQGQWVRNLTFDMANDEHLALFAPHCRALQGLNLGACGITSENLMPYLKHLSPTLRWLELESYVIQAASLFPVLSTHLHGLEYVNFAFPSYKGPSVLHINALLDLLHNCPSLKEIELTRVNLVVEGEDVSNALMYLESSYHPQQQQPTNITMTTKKARLEFLTLESCILSDTALTTVLALTSNLKSLFIARVHSLSDTGIQAIPSLCPQISSLTLTSCPRLDPDTFSALFMNKRDLWRLRYVDLAKSNINDTALAILARDQGDFLEILTLERCQEVTNAGVDAILRHCPRLESLSLNGLVQATTAGIMEGPQDRWACWQTLERLDLRRLGVVDLEFRFAEDDPRVATNKKAWGQIKHRVQLLPRLRKLAVGVFGVHAELLAGFGVQVRLHTLNLRGLAPGGIEGEELELFVANYSGLKRLILNQGRLSHCTEMIPTLARAGITVVDGESRLWQ
ncbi:MAG: hypothetical protein BYD32DRAFT_413579 [Podila humilis]|nr:MAG: hypothetical protein BYD32DRAFT_413579 [Podila humilis]